jgi:fructose-1,6-bisphosphatase/inositol monophosphatase family enzyme
MFEPHPPFFAISVAYASCDWTVAGSSTNPPRVQVFFSFSFEQTHLGSHIRVTNTKPGFNKPSLYASILRENAIYEAFEGLR